MSFMSGIQVNKQPTLFQSIQRCKTIDCHIKKGPCHIDCKEREDSRWQTKRGQCWKNERGPQHGSPPADMGIKIAETGLWGPKETDRKILIMRNKIQQNPCLADFMFYLFVLFCSLLCFVCLERPSGPRHFTEVLFTVWAQTGTVKTEFLRLSSIFTSLITTFLPFRHCSSSLFP